MMPFWTDAYLGDTSDLSTEEHGAYMLLLIHAWRSKSCSIPNEDKKIARIVRLTPVRWKRIKSDVLSFWVFDEEARVWTQKRLLKEWEKQKAFSRGQSEKAKKRWNSGKENLGQGRSKILKYNETDYAAAGPEEIPAEAEAEAKNYYTTPAGRSLTAEQISLLLKSGGHSIDHQHPCIRDITVPSQWIEGKKPSDFGLDVLPTIKRLAEKRKKPRGIKSWEYFTEAIQEARDRRELHHNNRKGLSDGNHKFNNRSKQLSIAARRRSAACKVVSQY